MSKLGIVYTYFHKFILSRRTLTYKEQMEQEYYFMHYYAKFTTAHFSMIGVYIHGMEIFWFGNGSTFIYNFF